MMYSLPRAYAVFCGRFIITVNCMHKNKVNSPVFVYNDSHLSLKQQYVHKFRTQHVHVVVCQKGLTNSADPDQTASSEAV